MRYLVIHLLLGTNKKDNYKNNISDWWTYGGKGPSSVVSEKAKWLQPLQGQFGIYYYSKLLFSSLAYKLLMQTASVPDFISYFCVCFLLDGDICVSHLSLVAWRWLLSSGIASQLQVTHIQSSSLSSLHLWKFWNDMQVQVTIMWSCWLSHVTRPTSRSLASTLVLLPVVPSKAVNHTHL